MSIPGSANPLLLASAAEEAGVYQISRSVRLNSADSAYFSRTPASAGNRKTWTWAGWVKRSGITTDWLPLFQVYDGSSRAETNFLQLAIYLDQIGIATDTVWLRRTQAVYRDYSAWMHVVCAFDTTQATGSDRVKIYVNGSQVTAFALSSDPTQNADYGINRAVAHQIGQRYGGQYFSGYLADVHFIDGQALDPTSFGEFDTNGVWQPIAYTGTYGTNGFHLPFSDNSTAAALGTDTSGNSNTWTVNNISVTAGSGNDSLVDTPTNYGTDTGAGGEVRGNYCTWSATYAGAAGLSNGNLDYLAPATMSAFGSFSLTSGKWYWEFVNSGTGLSYVGIMDSTITSATDTSWSTQGRAYVPSGSKYDGSSTLYGASWTVGDVIGFALDLDVGTLTFYKNGVSQGVAFSTGLVGKEWKPFVYGGVGSGCSVNFGQRPFAYTAPSGYKALCTTNLPAPTIADGSTAMDVKLYTGNGSTQTISGLGFSPDLVWIKNRAQAYNHKLLDTVRGATEELESNTADAEVTNADGLTAFNSDGFELGDDTEYNNNTETYVAWTWDAGSSTVTNTDGSITSQVRANPSAGFSIVSYTSVLGTQTVGHGLNVAPKLIITKNRSGVYNWWTFTTLIDGSVDYLTLNTTNAAANDATGLAAPTSTVFSVNANAYDIAGSNMIAYCFAPVAGYSSFGSYVGNGSADGPFVYTGFRPRWIMIKNTSAATNWILLDSRRLGYNGANPLLFPDSAVLEAPGEYVDLLANGFKSRGANVEFNNNTQTYVYAAFAEHPFQYARAR